MLTLEQLQERLSHKWPELARSQLLQESVFPLRIPLGVPQGQELLHDFPRVQHWLQELRPWAESAQLALEYMTVRHRHLGEQRVPRAVIVPDWPTYMRLTGRADVFSSIAMEWQATLTQFPALSAWCREHLQVIERHVCIWPQIRAVLAALISYRGPPMYLRQLSIAGVDTKFIEGNRALIHKLLVLVLPSDQFDASADVVSMATFCRKFRLKYDQPLIRLRWLDETFAVTTAGLHDITTTIGDFTRLCPGIKKVYITENKINGLAFPAVPNAMVIFGLGYGIELLEAAAWLQDKQIYYWGDIDTHGFAMLARLRRLFPQTVSLLMDEPTFVAHKAFWTHEHAATFDIDRQALTKSEHELLEKLLSHSWGERLRLEQESVSFAHVVETLGR